MSVVDLPDGDWNEPDYQMARGQLKDRYEMYVMNPRYSKGVEYSLWIRDEHGDFPVMSSNTGGFTTFNSRSEDAGDGLTPTDEFFELVAYAVHEAMCFTPTIYWRGDARDFRHLADRIYGGKEREYEVWTAHTLAHYMTDGRNELYPELEPLAEWASQHTEMPVPILKNE